MQFHDFDALFGQVGTFVIYIKPLPARHQADLQLHTSTTLQGDAGAPGNLLVWLQAFKRSLFTTEIRTFFNSHLKIFFYPVNSKCIGKVF